MTRRRKIALIAGGSIAGLVVALLVTGIAIVHTQWFSNFVRQKIVSSVEEATGGGVEIAAFSFDWTHLRADVRNFVIHGLEPPGGAPLFRAKLLEVDLKLLSPFKGMVDIASLLVDEPQANVIVYPDGRTNIPAPKIKKPSDKSGLESIVNLAVGKFDLRNASFSFAERKTSFTATGQNLIAHLDYSALHPSYTGELDMSPLYLKLGANQTVNVNVKLPVTLEKDKISVANAQLLSPQSQVVISGSMEHLLAPRYAAHVNARIALDEMRRAGAVTIPLDTNRGPRIVNADITAAMTADLVRIQSARLTVGHSNLEASGTLKDGNKPGAVQFNSTLALGELGRLLRLSAQPEGTVRIGGNANLRPNNDYSVMANVDARNVAIRQGNTRLAGINLDSIVTADPHRIELAGLRLAAMGGSFAGSASLVEMTQFHLSGNLRNFDIAQVSRALGGRPLDYSGVVSGPVQAEGNIKTPAALAAKANLAIAPGRGGIPVSGKLNFDYEGRADTVTLGQSYLALPNTRVDLSGALGRQIQVRLVSRNLSDFQPIAAIPVTFNNGAATLDAMVSGKLSAPRITGHLAMNNFAVDGRPFTRFETDLDAANSGVSIRNAALARGPLQANLSATIGLRNWKPEPAGPLRLDATVRNADLADVLALAGQSSVPAAGAFTADAHITGTIGSPQGNANFTVVNGAIEGGHFDQLNARAVMSDRSIDIPTLQWIAGPSRIDANASYQHAQNDLERGVLRAHVASNQVQLAQFQALVKDRPGLAGTLSLNADAEANLAPARGSEEVQLTSLHANLAARSLQMQGKNLGDFTATANTAGSTLQYNVNSDFAGSTIRVNGESLLTGNHQTTASASIANLPIDQVLALAGRRDLPVSGVLAADARVSGTLDDPRAQGNFTITKGLAWQEPFDRLQTTVNYSNQLVDVPSLRLTAGPSELDLTASLSHPLNDLQDGQLRFRVRTNQVQLARFHNLQQSKPGLAGTIDLVAEGAATLRRNQAPLLANLNVDLAARNLSVNKKPAGDLTATAQTRGREVEFNLKSDFAHSDISGTGRMELAGDYALNAQVNFSKVTYSGISDWIGGPAQAGFDGSADGQVTVSGPVTRTSALRGNLQLSRLEAHSINAPGGRKPRVNFELHNAAPIVVALDRSTVTIQSARITGPSTDLSLAGTASIDNPQTLNLRADGTVKLDILEAFNPEVFSSGGIALNAAVSGTIAQPVVNGRLQLQKASFNMLSLPNGINNANGTIAFNGTEAQIQNITGETGGGKISLTGFVAYGGPEMQFRVQATADQVRVAYPDTVTTEASAQLTAAGTTSRSLLSGTVTILDVAMHSHSDVGSILSQAATPPASPTSSTGLLAGMRFDVRIQTAPDVQFRTTLTENLQADANLTLRGTLDHPGMLGRVAISQGDVVFFGYKYAIDQGTIGFYDPSKINPILNIDLATTAQGVDVSLSISGPMDRLKFSYHSDPPLQFSEIVSLLASGKAPTSDPVLAAHQPAAPQQNFQQMGASTLLGQAVANPVSGRLQRLFGVSKLKIDPQITGSSNTPQATLTLQQQISRDLTFTYISDITQTNPQIIRIEWAIDPRWSAIAQRDVNGQFDLDFFYKKRFW
jgi:translocation and assembly module TamB